ncbi:MAG: cytochrome c3 family protein [Bryobacteraceae bacterium]
MRTALVAACVVCLAADAPVQPVPYSHKQHIANGLKCADCHAVLEPGEMMAMPQAPRCMLCHRAIKQDSPAIQKVAGFQRENRAIPWVRVYEIPSFVRFSHKTHLDAGATCEKCHGPVAERDVLSRETDISMNGCMACHRANKADISCTYCHDKLD